MADIHGSPGDPGLQMPQASDSGSAPVPFAGALPSEPPPYAVDLGPVVDHPLDMVHAVTNLGTTEDPSATSLSPAAVSGDAPYYPGPLSPINAAGDPDAGGRDDVAGDVATAVANATGRWQEFQGDLGAGGTYGDLMQFPPIGEDPGAGVGNTLPTAGFYDPPRGYGGASGAPDYGGNTGNEPPPPGDQGAPN